MPQIVIHLRTPPSEEAREAALGPDGPVWCRELLGGWRQYLAVTGTAARVNRQRAAAEADAERLGLDLEIVVPQNLPVWVAERGYIPSELRDTEQNFCTTELTELAAGGPARAPDSADPQRFPLKFIARDVDGNVLARGFCNSGGAQRASDAFHRFCGATHIDLYKRDAQTKRIDTIRWTPPAPAA